MFEIFHGGRSKIRRIAQNDDTCGWIKVLPPRQPAVRLIGPQRADWAIVGAGLFGLSAAIRLAHLFPRKSIALIDAQRAGECSAGRNSGFAIEVSPPRGIVFEAGKSQGIAERLRAGYLVNMEGLAFLRVQVQANNIDCDWQEIGKTHVAVSDRHVGYLDGFADVLGVLGVPRQRLGPDELRVKLGTAYYRQGLWTGQAVQVQPAALARGLAESLRGKVEVFEDSPVQEIEYGDVVTMKCREGTMKADNVIVATNGLMTEFGLFKRRATHLALTSGLTRQLTVAERSFIGNPEPYGLLSPSGQTRPVGSRPGRE